MLKLLLRPGCDIILLQSAAIIALHLVQLTGPDNQIIELNPETIVSLRAPRGVDHVFPSIHCLIHTTDGKVVTVTETCVQVQQLLE